MIAEVPILTKIIITSLSVMAIWATMWEGAIFEFISEWGEKHLPEKLQKPIYACPICMVPYYGSALYWLILGSNWIEWGIVIISAMGLNAVLVKLFPDD